MASKLSIEQAVLPFSAPAKERVLSVSELNDAIQRIFEGSFRGISVFGEISGCRTAASGHFYFSIKDGQSQLKCALFKGAARYARFKPQDGLAVIARGNLEVYAARGEYQLIVESLQPQGAGALQIAFEQLKQRLAAEGLFETARKRRLSALPRRIGIVTSPSGAVIQDILQILDRRFRGLHIRIYPALVQGEGSLDQICNGLRYFSEQNWAEVIILARGGGSLEDLWTFNEEAVARSIVASKVPVISAIGHETDFTIADFAADLRAPTPSAAAELVICTAESLLERVAALRTKALQGMRYRLLVCSRNLHARGTERAARVVHRRLANLAQRLDESVADLDRLRRALFVSRHARLSSLQRRLEATNLQLRLSRVRHRLDATSERLLRTARRDSEKRTHRLSSLTLHLRQLSPLLILGRGYAIVHKPDGSIVREAASVAPGDRLRILVSRGEIDALAEAAHNQPGE